MVDQKRFPPSELKLRRLRQAGVVAASRDVLTFGVGAGLALSMFLFFQTTEPHLEKFRKLLTLSGTTGEAFTASWSWFVELSVQLLWPIIAVLILVGFLQNRFLIAFGAMNWDASRLFQISNIFENIPGRFGLSLLAVFRFLIWGAVVFILVYSTFLDVPWDSLSHAITSGDTGERRSVETQYGAQILWRFLLATVVCSFGIGLASRFAAGLRFQREHGMTRAEVEAEDRETELAPEMKRAIALRTGRRNIE